MNINMKFFAAFLIALAMSGTYGLADMQGEGPDRDIDVAFEDDTAPIVNCKTAKEDIAALEKQIADLKTKLREEVEGLVPPSTPEAQGILDPTKDIQASEGKEKELTAKIANIKEVCNVIE